MIPKVLVIDLKSNLNSGTSESLNLAKAILEPSLEQNNYECDNGDDDDGVGVGKSKDIHSGAWHKMCGSTSLG